MSIHVVLCVLVFGGGAVGLIIGLIANRLGSSLMRGTALVLLAMFGVSSCALCLCFDAFGRTTPTSEPEVTICELVEIGSSDNYYYVANEKKHGFVYIGGNKATHAVNDVAEGDIEIYYNAEPNTGECNRVVVYREILRKQWWIFKDEECVHYRYELYLGGND